MATNTAANITKPAREKKVPIALVERVKGQLSTAALRAKITVTELEALEAHCAKLRGLLA